MKSNSIEVIGSGFLTKVIVWRRNPIFYRKRVLEYPENINPNAQWQSHLCFGLTIILL